METLSLMDLFLIVVGVAVVFVAAFLLVALFYLVMFLRTIKTIAGQASRAADFVVEDLGEFTKSVKQEGFKLGSLIKFVLGLKSKQSRKKK